MKKIQVGIIGGSGLCKFPEIKIIKKIKLHTKYGYPSDKIIIGEYNNKIIAFLPRHGKSHFLPPHKIPYKANISAFKKLGVEHIIATCIVGSLKKNIKPGDFMILDQFINFTWGRDDYFDIEKKVIHLPMAKPYCSNLRKLTYDCAKKIGINTHRVGTAVVIQGPRFSTEAESNWFSSQKWDIVNMTQYPECYFAREAGMCYVSIAMITDYDVGVKNNLQINIEGIAKVLEIFNNDIKKVKKLIFEIIKELPNKKNCECPKSLINEYYKYSLKRKNGKGN